MITIIDYGMGNLRSVQKAFERLNTKVSITNNPSDLLTAEKIVLPGVGHFKQGINNLKALGFIESLNEAVLVRKTPILGICLGMQLMTDFSEEGNVEGLGYIKGETKRFISDNSNLKIPHIGWNSVKYQKTKPSSFLDLKEDDLVYFVHSYYVRCQNSEDVIYKTNYIVEFDSAFQSNNIIGFQFHPEKSHKIGLKLLTYFLNQ